MKFGVLVRYYQWIGYDSSNYAGIFTYTGVETQSAASAGGDGFADFLLGYPASVAARLPTGPTLADSVGTINTSPRTTSASTIR